MIEYIKDTKDEQEKWKWMHSTPDALLSFCDNQDVFLAILEKVKIFNAPIPTKFSASKKYSNENTILHQVSKDPLSDTQMDIVMTILLQEDVRPDGKNSDGNNFLSLSSIHPKLLQRFHTATDGWATLFFNCCIANPEVLVSWVELGDDLVLEAIFDRIRLIRKHVRKLFKSRNSLHYLYVHLGPSQENTPWKDTKQTIQLLWVHLTWRRRNPSNFNLQILPGLSGAMPPQKL